MRILVKLGGTLLDEQSSLARLAGELAELHGQGIELAVVHGGGRQMTRFLAERGMESRFVNGLRVSSPEVIDALLMVLAGRLNHTLVAALVGAGARAVGLSGIDGLLVEAEPLDPALGAVGRPQRWNTELLPLLATHGYLPVVACLAGDRQGNVYNVNADQMAVACAAAFGAERLLLLTDVNGVRDQSGNVVGTLDWRGASRLIQDQVATGGMLAKLKAAHQALEQGIAEIRILPGAEPRLMERVLRGEALGTRLVRSL